MKNLLMPEGASIVLKKDLIKNPIIEYDLRNVDDTIVHFGGNLYAAFEHSNCKISMFDETNKVTIYHQHAPMVCALMTIAKASIEDEIWSNANNDIDGRLINIPDHGNYGLIYNISADYEGQSVIITALEDPDQITIPLKSAEAMAKVLSMFHTIVNSKG